MIADALLVWCRFAMRGDHQSCGAKVGRHLAEQDRGGSSAVAGSDDHGEITGSFDRALYDGSAFSVDQTAVSPSQHCYEFGFTDYIAPQIK